MWKAVALFCLVHFFCSTNAQTRFNGSVSSPDKTPASGVNIMVFSDLEAKNMVGFGFSADDGSFSVDFTHSSDSVAMFFKSMNYRDTVLLLNNKSRRIDLLLNPMVHHIKEVNVSAVPYYRKGDTITYHVQSFAKGKDISIADVIANMPGFQVSDEGQVSYLGQPIQKYYVEGMDLMGSKYAMVNKNLPHKTVSSVEVMQNHQPVKMLQTKVHSEGTSINIKLKNKVVATGTIHAGAGFSPFLRHVNLTPMVFSKNQQWVASWQSNNTGDDLFSLYRPLAYSMGRLSGLNEMKREYVDIERMSRPMIEPKRYLFNDANLLSYSHLIKLSSDAEIKVNAFFFSDNKRENGVQNTSYYLGNDIIRLRETKLKEYRNRSASLDVIYLKNSKDSYLQNKFNVINYWDTANGDVDGQTIQNESAKTPFISFSNELDWMFPVKNNIFSFYSLVGYGLSDQNLMLEPGTVFFAGNEGAVLGSVGQFVRSDELNTHHYLRFTLSKAPVSFDSEVGVKYKKHNFDSSMELDGVQNQADSLRNDLGVDCGEFYFSEAMRYEVSRIKVRVELPFSYFSYHINQKGTPITKGYALISPSVRVTYDVSGFWKFRFSTGFNTDFEDGKSLADGYLIQSFRSMRRDAGELIKKQRWNYAIFGTYNNVISGFQASASYNGSIGRNGFLSHQKYIGSGVFYSELVEHLNYTRGNTVSFELGQYFANISSTAGLKGGFNRVKREYALNTVVDNLMVTGWFLEPGINVGAWNSFSLDYTFRVGESTQKTAQSNFTVSEQKQKMSLYYYPIKSHWVGVDAEHYRHQLSESSFIPSFMLANLTYSYSPAKKKIGIKIGCYNIFDKKSVGYFSNGDISTTESRYRIRPREVLFTLKYSI